MDASSFIALSLACAPQVHPATSAALVRVESGHNPWAIGVVGGALQRQPRSLGEALATAGMLHRAGWSYSVGLGQINVGNFQRLGLSLRSAFEPCSNLAAMQSVLGECFERARSTSPADELARQATQLDQRALRQALSCYYSGNFHTGFRHGYVQKVLAATGTSIPVVQSVRSVPSVSSIASIQPLETP